HPIRKRSHQGARGVEEVAVAVGFRVAPISVGRRCAGGGVPAARGDGGEGRVVQTRVTDDVLSDVSVGRRIRSLPTGVGRLAAERSGVPAPRRICRFTAGRREFHILTIFALLHFVQGESVGQVAGG